MGPQLGLASGAGKHTLHSLAVTRPSAAVKARKQQLYRLAVGRLGVVVEAMKQQKWVATATVNSECSPALGLPIALGGGKLI